MTIVISENRCVACGEPIPEGRMICPACEATVTDNLNPERLVAPQERTAGLRVPAGR